MRIPKHYGQSREDRCFFCTLQATTENSQGIPTCIAHKKETKDLKCACGEWLDAKKGKYGSFFLCMHCGPISLHKARELASPHGIQQKETRTPIAQNKGKSQETKKEITIRSDDPLYFD